MLPKWISKTGQHERAALIAEELKQGVYDVIIFQEAFGKKVRNILWEGLKETYPNQAGPVNSTSSSFRLNGGVWILSKIPMEQIAEIEYDECKGVDCMARKGALMVQVEKGGKQYQLVGTHLQSFDSERKHEIRRIQYKAIKEKLLEPNRKEGIPQLVCGDFNVSQIEKDLYDELIAGMKCTNNPKSFGVAPVKHTYDRETNDLIDGEWEATTLDYILLRRCDTNLEAVQRKVKIFTAPWSSRKLKNKRNLSDHHAVSIALKPE